MAAHRPRLGAGCGVRGPGGGEAKPGDTSDGGWD